MLEKISMFRVYLSRLWVIALLVGFGGQLSAQAPAAEEDIRGPKPLVEIPQPEKSPVVLWLSLGASALLLGLAVVLWKKQSAKQKLKNPREIAMASLSQLDANREALAAEVFANRAAQTVRQYIAERFGIAAPRRTTEEFFQDLTKQVNSPLISESDHLQHFLKSCDLAKFAGSSLSSKQRDELLQAARGFILTAAAPISNTIPKAATS
jgi:Domain of unknown function (DUF4381)